MKLIRIILSVILAYGVYTETGTWTAVAVLLIIVGMETLYTFLGFTQRLTLTNRKVLGDLLKELNHGLKEVSK